MDVARAAMTLALPDVFIALDDSTLDGVRKKAESISRVSGSYGLKVNLDALAKDGVTTSLQAIAEFGRPMFADFKGYNGARTLGELLKDAARGGAVMSNIFPGNAAKLLAKVAKVALGEPEGNDAYPPILIFGIGPLTHMTEEDCQAVYGCDFAEATLRLGRRSVEAGFDGYIGPGSMNDVLKDLGVPLLNPAVRPDWYEDTGANDQEQTVTPTKAIVAAAGQKTILVVGSPVNKSPDPEVALKQILEEVAAAKV